MRLLAMMVAALTLAVSAPVAGVAGAAGGAGSDGGGPLPRLLTVILGLTAAALATRALRRSRRR